MMREDTLKRLVVFGVLALLMTQVVMAQNWDINTLHAINGWDSGLMRDYSSFISKTEPYVAVGMPLAMGIAGLATRNDALLKDAVFVGTTVAGSFAVAFGMKYVVDRNRPYVSYPDRVHPYSYEDSPSFPSGHTCSAFALATSLSIRYPKWYVITPSAVWACSVGLSRMNEGVHYPTDVMTGAALGVGLAFANVYVNRWVNKWLFGH